MCPELFHIGSIPIRGYGLMLAISFFVGVLYVRYLAKKHNRPFEPLLNIAYIMVFGGIIGARFFYVVLHLEEFSGRWLNTINPFAGNQFGIAGLNLYGGILLAIIGTFVYCRVTGLSILDVFDFFAPTLGIGLAFTRIGCFMNGCCFGVPSDLPWAVTFPADSLPYYVFGSLPLHPTQLYSSIYGLLLFILLHNLLKHRRFVGQIVAVLFMVEAVFRFAIEYVRYYEDAMYFTIGGIHPTYNQLVSVSLFVLGLVIYITQSRKSVTPVK